MIIMTKELFKVAYGNFAIGAYNINNMEQYIGLFKGKQGLHFVRMAEIQQRLPDFPLVMHGYSSVPRC